MQTSSTAEISDHSSPATSRQRRKAERREQTGALLECARLAEGDERDDLLGQVVELNLGVASDVAKRYRGRGIPDEDLEQVAHLALVKAVRAFDPVKANDLLTFAVPTIRGELRRHFRDQGWVVRPPRSIQELQASVTAAEAELCQSLGRQPRAEEVAAELGVDAEQVAEAQSANGCFAPSSLDDTGRDGSDGAILDRLGAEDDGFSNAEARAMLGPLLKDLSEREQRILELRFWRGWTQAEIGADIGVTQMQVSRLLQRTLTRLRSRLADGVAA